LDDAKSDVDRKLQLYNWSLISLHVKIGSVVLELVASANARAALDDLFPKKTKAVQAQLVSNRAKGTGSWILQTGEVRDWIDGETSLLICTGIRTAPIN